MLYKYTMYPFRLHAENTTYYKQLKFYKYKGNYLFSLIIRYIYNMAEQKLNAYTKVQQTLHEDFNFPEESCHGFLPELLHN
jgi:hypothetical protein